MTMLLAAVVGVNAFAVDIVENAVSGQVPKGTMPRKENVRKGDIYESTACPEGTTKGYPFGTQSSMAGYCFSDEGYSIYWQGQTLTGSSSYTAFSENYYAITGLQFYAQSIAVSSRAACSGRLGYPITFRIQFLEPGSDGYPNLDKVVYEEEVTLQGEDTGLGNSYGHIYKYYTPLKGKVNMNEGYWLVQALKDEHSGDCCFCLAGHNAVDGACVAEAGGIWFAGANIPAYCFVSDGTALAKKSIKLNDFISPMKNENSFYAPVEFSFINNGSDPIYDGQFELYLDGKLISSEKYAGTIPSQETCTMQFKARLDLHEGSHKIEVKNVTPSDQHLSPATISMETEDAHLGGDPEPVESYGNAQYDWINTVNICQVPNGETTEPLDTISHTTGQPSPFKIGYTDCRDNKIGLLTGASIDVYAQVHVYDGAFGGAWVDWNNDGNFTDEELVGRWTNDECGHIGDDIADAHGGEFMGKAIRFSIPEGMQVAPGDKTLRIVFDATSKIDKANPAGKYAYGETEDYTITVLGNPTAGCIDLSEKYLNLVVDSEDGKYEDSYEISNLGGAPLQTRFDVAYKIPGDPSIRGLANYPASNTSLTYSSDNSFTAMGTEDDDITWGCYYPKEMMSNLAGMTLNSVDVGIASLYNHTYLEIYEGVGNNMQTGMLLTKQEFSPVADNWNTFMLNEPIALTGKDLWITVHFSGGLKNSSDLKYQINADKGPATPGYGDRLLYSGYWWNASELFPQYNFNLCIRGNLSGTPTKALSWLDITKEAFSVPANSSVEMPYTINVGGLDKGLYEATLHVKSDDGLNPDVAVPVWLKVDKDYTKIDVVPMNTAHIYTSGSELVVKSDKTVSSVSVIDMGGATRSLSLNNRVNIKHLLKSPYVIRVVYTDGTEEKAMMLLK